MPGFYPKKREKTAYSIDFEKYYAEGYRAVLFDIDNTLVKHEAPHDDQADALFAYLKNIGLKTCLVSNNHEPRVKSFAEGVGADFYVCDAGKPGRDGYVKAMETLGTDSSNTLMVGDQLFTDMWGANRAGICSILVDQIDKDPYLYIKLKRVLEKIVMIFYRR